MNKLGQYKKTIAVLVTAIIGWTQLVLASAPSEVTAEEYLALAIALAGAFGVYSLKNDPPPA